MPAKTKRPSRQRLIKALHDEGGVLRRVAASLGCSHTSLYRWLRQLDLCTLAGLESSRAFVSTPEHTNEYGTFQAVKMPIFSDVNHRTTVGRLEAAEFLSVSKSTFDRIRKTPGFPRPFRLPALKRGAPRWFTDEIEAWAHRQKEGA